MKINIGDKFVVAKKMWLTEGTVATVIDVNKDNIISFTFGENSTGYMDCFTFEKYFEKLQFAEPKNVEITYEYVDKIMQNSEFEIWTVFGTCAVVSCKLPNGYVIVESEFSPNVNEYDENVYVDICFSKIAQKIFKLETYKNKKTSPCDSYSTSDSVCYYNCYNCYCDECHYNKEDFIEPDCENCTDYDCEFNLRNSTVTQHSSTTKYPLS